MSFLIRVVLPDTPGSLGQLADAFGMVNANIESVDVVEHSEDGTVTDDIVVNLPQGVMADSILTAASAVDGVIVDSFRPFSGSVDRRGQIALLSRVATAKNVKAGMQEVANAIPKAMTSSWAIVIDNNPPIHRLASSSSAPADDGTVPADIKVPAARVLHADQDAWVPHSWSLLDSTLAAAPLGATGLTLVIGRVGGPEFLTSEVEHLRDIGNILGAVLR
ncbi:amino acid-binding ACT domain protein [Corynebacterium phocae]|uniref:Amino acid-binding ACT domain protein n=1 Tax=Corynebacterium phocae TaxID=161895 RepID=A0A1L7D3T8_9CORY|nr:amino acid-binding ACT domain protein [Corynebacterium phocae]APT92737.1 amino acid-binding ACT domain protein [Corynebacterium phocae]KAA8723046.1 amino acid-binding ACT domain protein [Corynebacterium phocae]